jgi:hypothetical protein
MATVVLIHAPADTTPARALADKLRQAQVKVVVGSSGPELRQLLMDAPVAIALWSPNAVNDPSVVDDATYARATSRLVHACMQNTQAPGLFGGDPVINLTGWRGEDDFAPWRELAAIVTRSAGVEPLPEPRQRASSGFFQPGRATADAAPAGPRSASVHQFPAPPRPDNAGADSPAPPPRETPVFSYASSNDWRSATPDRPRLDRDPPPLPMDNEGGRGAMVIALLVIALGAIGGGGVWFLTQQGATASASAWESVDRNDPEALRAFIERYQGRYRDEAQAVYDELEERRYRRARDADTIEALQAFIASFPDSERFGLAARGRIAELRTAGPVAPVTTEALVPLGEEAAPVDPDLVPPGAVELTEPPPSPGGPVPLNSPAEPEPSPGNAPLDLGAPIQTN